MTSIWYHHMQNITLMPCISHLVSILIFFSQTRHLVNQIVVMDTIFITRNDVIYCLLFTISNLINWLLLLLWYAEYTMHEVCFACKHFQIVAWVAANVFSCPSSKLDNNLRKIISSGQRFQSFCGWSWSYFLFFAFSNFDFVLQSLQIRFLKFSYSELCSQNCRPLTLWSIILISVIEELFVCSDQLCFQNNYVR